MTDTIVAPAAAAQPGCPSIVSDEEWQGVRAAFLAKEKAHMRAGDALAAERRRLPMVEIDKRYTFEGPEGRVNLLDLFDGRSQLIVYHFMFHPSWDEGCTGCSMLADNLGHPAHLHARDTSRVLISRAPLSKITPFKQRMGWTEPWYSSFGSDFNIDFVATVDDEETHPLTVLLRDGDRIFRTYSTDARGCEVVLNTFSFLDLTPLGRQELWEDSPADPPQTPLYEWWRLHDRYDGSDSGAPELVQQVEPGTEGCSCCHS